MSGLAARITLPLLLIHAGIVWAQTPATVPAAPAPAVSTAKPANSAGVIDLMEGDVRVFDANQVRRTGVKLKDPVGEGDSVVTGADGELHLNMQDGGYIAVRPNTAMKIMQYRANGDANDTSVFGIVKGALRSVTGFIGQFNARSTKIITPTATIGIRGTDHETFVVEQNDTVGEAGTYDKVNAGGTFIETPQGRTEVTPDHAGFASSKGDTPRVLDRVPGFFKPTRNERLIEGRHAQMQRKLQQLREQRRQQVQQREGGAPGAKAQTPAANKAATNAHEKGGKALEPANAKSTAPGQVLQERQQAKGGEMQQRLAQHKQAMAEQQQKRQAARQQAIAAQQKARQERMEAQKKALQQKRRTPAEREKEQ
jgi:hypothetical protein